MPVRAQDYNSLVGQLKAAQTQIARLNRAGAVSGEGVRQRLAIARVEVVNDTDDPETYQIRILIGASRKDSAWLLDRVLPASPDATFSVGDIAPVIINDAGPNYLISATGGGDPNDLLVPHSHNGRYDGGWLGALSGER